MATFSLCPHIAERESKLSSYEGTNPFMRAPPHEPIQPTSSTITLAGRASIYEFEGWTQFSPQQYLVEQTVKVTCFSFVLQ